MNYEQSIDPWLQELLTRLSAKGFVIEEHVPWGSVVFRYVARRTRIELSKFGYAETFFVFLDIPNLDALTMQRFTSDAYLYAHQSKTIPLPLGFGESIWCIAVALTDSLDEVTANRIKREPPNFHYGAGEFSVVFDRRARRLCYLEKTPFLGLFIWISLRRLVKKLLATAT